MPASSGIDDRLGGERPVRVTITRRATEAIVAHARADRPRECCGLLLGTGGRIERAVPARNRAERPTRFLVDPDDHFAAIREARRAGQTVVGVYHSHPASPARPSPTDLAETLPGDDIHVIVSLSPTVPVAERLAAYRRRAAGFEAVPLEVEEVSAERPAGR